MKSRALTMLLVVSMLLCMATIVLWVRGYWWRDGFWYTTDSTRYSLHTYRGRIWVWSLSPVNYPTASVWPTQAKMRPGFVWDSLADAWYAPYVSLAKGGRLPEDFLDAPANFG